jgi:TM2 domain-containing membrane protein YozV
MAIFIHCPSCNQQLDNMASDCPHCGTELPPGILYSLSIALGEASSSVLMTTPERLPPHLTQTRHTSEPQPDVVQPVQNSSLRPWLAATLSLLCGLGQLYNGQMIKGLVLIVLGSTALLIRHLPLVQLLMPAVWLYAVIDAYLVARRTSSPHTSLNTETAVRH